MNVLFTILKIAVVTVLAASLVEALVISARHGWRSYDWKASGISVMARASVTAGFANDVEDVNQYALVM